MKLPFKQTGIVKPVTTSTTLNAPDAIYADPSGGAITITLPATVAANDLVRIYLDPSISTTNTVTIARNGNTINGAASNLVMNSNTNKQVDLIYTGTTWKSVVIGSSSASGGVTVSDTPPSSPTNGAMWFESDTFELYVYYSDGTTGAWIKANATNQTNTALRPYVWYERNYQQSVGTTALTEVAFNVSRGNTISGITMLANGSGFTNNSGLTLQLTLSSSVRWGFNIASGSCETWWSHRNSSGTELTRVGWVMLSANSGNLAMNNSGTVMLANGESIRLVAYQQSGASAEMYYNANAVPRMMIIELGRG